MGTFTLTLNPEMSGYIGSQYYDDGTAWSTVRASGGTYDGGTQPNAYIIKYSNTSNWMSINRGFLIFGAASALPTDATITGAKVRLYVVSKKDNLGDAESVCLVNTSTTNDDSIVLADFNLIGTTQYATDLTVSSISNAAYCEWTLNATGLAAISKTGKNKYGLMTAIDRTNSPPSGTPTGDRRGGIDDSHGYNAANKPELVITYTRPESFLTMF